MRLSVMMLSTVVAAAGLMGHADRSAAQSPYSYAWCAVYPWDGGRSCYYHSMQQCLQAQSGITNLCVENPAYRPSATSASAPPPAVPTPPKGR